MNAANTEQTPPTFAVKFSLTVTVEGTSLQDIDNGLVQAAGQRLAARMQNPPRLNGVDVLSGSNAREEPRAPVSIVGGARAVGGEIHGSSPAAAGVDGGGSAGGGQAGSVVGAGAAVAGGPVDAGGAEPAAAGGKKTRGVKPGAVRGPYKKTPAEEAAESAAAAQGTPPQAAAQAPQAAPPAAPIHVAQVVTPQAPAAQGQIPTLDQCVAALTKVNTQKTTDIAYKCLTDMGVKRCGEIPEARRAEFIAKCEAAAAGA